MKYEEGPQERPILFSAAMVRAILSGQKTQTRRIISPQPDVAEGMDCTRLLFKKRNAKEWFANYASTDPSCSAFCPYGAVGDLIWVREAYSDASGTAPGQRCALYRASYSGPSGIVWKPSIFMPRWACRINLEVTGVRCERLQDISEADAKAEGISEPEPSHGHWCDPKLGREGHWSYRKPYAALWDSINGRNPAKAWAANPWVFVVEFRRSA
jgi:hypothetical protein